LEVVVSTFIVGILLVVAMQTAGSVASGQLRSAEQGRARLLAAELMGEILCQAYEEPVDTPLFGPEPGESASGTRTDYDDVDDYHGWTASPPVDKQGDELTGLAVWQRSVTVALVDPEDLGTVAGEDLGVKRVTVSVTRNGTAAASLTAALTDSWQPPPYEQP
jgi:hypothetical protein